MTEIGRRILRAAHLRFLPKFRSLQLDEVARGSPSSKLVGEGEVFSLAIA